jgi:hypothetical protein
MLTSHPRPININRVVLLEALAALHDCALACTSCADACLGEKEPQNLVRCIRLNLDCADVCEATGRLLSRQTEPDWSLIRAQLEACASACRSCGDECQRHAGMHQHCQVCAESCRRCEQACNRLLQALPV